MTTPPRIGIDGFNIALEQGTGVATYGRNLVKALRGMGAEVSILYGRDFGRGRDDLLREINFFDPPPRRPSRWPSELRAWVRGAQALRDGEEAFEVTLSGRVIGQDFAGRLPRADRTWNVESLFGFANGYFNATGRPLQVRLPKPVDVMHWTYPLPIEVVGAKNIYTLHDLVPLRLPHTTLDRKRRYLRLMRMLVRRADHIVTVSECSRRDIMDLLQVPAGKVTNTYQSAETPPGVTDKPEAEVRAEVEGVFGLPYKGYFLFFGAIEPKKNVGRLLQAFFTANLGSPLVLAGKRAWKADEELRLLRLEEAASKERTGPAAGKARRVIEIEYLPLPLLMTLVRGARAVVFPSLYEGFGLPVAEAMRLGVPVITSSTSSLPEVGGQAALYVDPYDPAALVAALRRLDADAGLRDELSARGRVEAERFTEAAYRLRLEELYAKLGVAGLRAP